MSDVLDGALERGPGPTRFYVLTLRRAACSNYDGTDHEVNRIVCVLTDHKAAEDMRELLTDQALEFLAMAERICELARNSATMGVGPERVERRDQMIQGFANKLLDYRWQNTNIWEAVLWQKAGWSYSIRHAYDDPSEVVY